MVCDDMQRSYSSSIGLKTVFGGPPACSGAALELSSSGCKAATSRLRRAIRRQDVMQLGSSFITGCLLGHVNVVLLLRHPAVPAALLPQLASSLLLAVCKHSMPITGVLVMTPAQRLRQDDGLAVGGSAEESVHVTEMYVHPAQQNQQPTHGDHLERPLMVEYCRVGPKSWPKELAPIPAMTLTAPIMERTTRTVWTCMYSGSDEEDNRYGDGD
ncbi:hypothetical protein HPB48_022152 [Haemaphysalis longicornis]|uniref:Uncharacterized protein n=1 Tax=Haemaphysalis longicornis TaxID=44386 RepID=A0A9J6FDT1_HAELO|nr:hypothetical protein HPB48_022152 [Haemaphysalis longicornis]